VSDRPAPEAFELQALLDAAVDAVVLINHRGIIEVFNHSATRLFGYGSDEVLGRNVKILMTASDSERHDSHLENHVRTGIPHIIGTAREVQARRKDGSLFPAFLSVGRISGCDPRASSAFFRTLHYKSMHWQQSNERATAPLSILKLPRPCLWPWTLLTG